MVYEVPPEAWKEAWNDLISLRPYSLPPGSSIHLPDEESQTSTSTPLTLWSPVLSGQL